MLCMRCLPAAAARTSTRPILPLANRPTLLSRPSLTRPLSLLTPRRPLPPTPSATSTAPSTTTAALPPRSSLLFATPALLGAAPSTHPALAAHQLRHAPRNTMQRWTHLVRKRRHGFLSRTRTKNGRKILARRRRKGRNTLSH